MDQTTAEITIKIRMNALTPETLGDVSDDVRQDIEFEFASGDGDGQIEDYYRERLTVPASGSIILDLGTGGGLVNPHNEAIDWQSLKGLVFYNRSENDFIVVTGNGGNMIPIMADPGDDLFVLPLGLLVLLSPEGYDIVGGDDQILLARSGLSTDDVLVDAYLLGVKS